ncbi:MAG: hypothetical protein V4689_19340 [Verrucomicrobiota bacterium]
MRHFPLLFACCLFPSCGPKVTPDQAVATAYRYTQVEWMPEQRHVRHGADARGIAVQTPDRTLTKPGGWWKPGVMAKSMPYQWGGFDTPETFTAKIAAGKKAGDIATDAKRKLGDAGTSAESCGIDCSGFVSRCWNLNHSVSTAQLPDICVRLNSWNDLRPGDILLNNKHVVLFAKWKHPGREIDAYEAGPFPVWRVSACGLQVEMLKKLGYTPWRFKGMKVVAEKAPGS